ncbi:MAG: poly-gamma-glutamate system protein [Acidobacteriota bacterium]|nr:poly-gamma-glutamate system protein [Acidobacteriota bacterium]
MRTAKLQRLTLFYLAGVSLVFYLIFYVWFEPAGRKLATDEAEAACLMQQAMKEIFSCQQKQGLQPEKNKFDLMRTGLIGLESSPLTTTLGKLEAKRTTTNPAISALLVRLLRQAGVKKGQVVAAGASSSFPALVLASYCAARAMNLKLLVIVSLGASQWGANNPDFSWLSIESCLRQAGFSQHCLLAVSWGGEDDSGREFPEDLKSALKQEAQASGLKFLEPDGLKNMVEAHLRLFQEAAGGQPIGAFINIGGSLVNLGLDASVLELDPGLTWVKKIPPPDRCGVIQRLAGQGIPVIHLLNIRGLAERYNLPWDPQPLPQSDQDFKLPPEKDGKKKLWLLFGAYLFFCAAGVIFNQLNQKNKG